MRDYLGSFLTRESLGQFLRLGVIGGFNTIVDFTLFNLFKFGLEWTPFWSVTWALVIATCVSYALNRRWTFRLHSFAGSVRESATFFAVSVTAWAVTVAVVELSLYWWGPLGPLGLNLAKVVSTGIILVPKFATYRDVVFRRSLEERRALLP